MIESYSVLAVSCCIHLQFLAWGSLGEVVQSLSALGFTALIISAPLFVGIYLNSMFDYLQNEEVVEKYGQFYVGLNLEQGRLVLLQSVWFMVRRLALALTVVFLNETVIWQLSAITFQVILQVIILG